MNIPNGKSAYRPAVDSAVQQSVDDKLGVKPFVDRLALPLLLTPVETSIVVALYGEWGTGKSTALNFLEEELARISLPENRPHEMPQPIVARFNPWLYGNVDALLISFFETIAEVVGSKIGNDKGKKKLKIALRGMAEFASTATKVGALFLPTFGGEIARKLVDYLPDVIEGTTKGTAEFLDGGEESFRKKREEAASVLRELGNDTVPRRVIVLIDDLDRAGPEEICAMLKLLKLVADLPNISYLVAMDRARVANTLTFALRPLNGAEFLEKIIQIGVTLPPIDVEMLSKLVVDSATDTLRRCNRDASALSIDWSGWKFIRDSTFERHLRRNLITMRDVVRLLNIYSFVMLSSESTADLHPVDLLLLTLLQVKHPGAYEAIRSNRAFFLDEDESMARFLARMHHDQREARIQERRKQFEGIVKQAALPTTAEVTEQPVRSTGNSVGISQVSEILLELFPGCIDGSESSEPAAAKSRREARIRSEVHFAHYFHFDQRPDSTSTQETKTFVDSIFESAREGNALQRLVADYRANSALKSSLLQQALYDYLDILDTERLVELSEALVGVIPRVDSSEAAFLDLLVGFAIRVVNSFGQPRYFRDNRAKPAAIRLAIGLVSTLPARLAAQVADHFLNSKTALQLEDDSETKKIIARTGCERSLEFLGAPEAFQPTESFRDFFDLMMICLRLEGIAGVSSENSTNSVVKTFLGALLKSVPASVAYIVAIGASYSEAGEPNFKMRTSATLRQFLSNFIEFDFLIAKAREVLDSGVLDSEQALLIGQFLQVAGSAAAEP